MPVHLVDARSQVDDLGGSVLVGVGAVVDSLGDGDLHPADGIDQIDEAVEVDEREVVDGDPRELLDTGDQRGGAGRAAPRETIGVAHPVVPELVDDGREAVTLPDSQLFGQRHPRQVAGNGEQPDVPGGGVEAAEDDRVGANPAAADAGVPAEQQHVEPLGAFPQSHRDRGRGRRGRVVGGDRQERARSRYRRQSRHDPGGDWIARKDGGQQVLVQYQPVAGNGVRNDEKPGDERGDDAAGGADRAPRW